MNVIHHLQRLKNKSHMIYQIIQRKIGKIQHLFVNKMLSILGTEKNFLNLIKNIFFLNWNAIALQCCLGFCCAMK